MTTLNNTTAFDLGYSLAEAVHNEDVASKTIAKSLATHLRPCINDAIIEVVTFDNEAGECANAIEFEMPMLPVLLVGGAYSYARQHNLGKSDKAVTTPKQRVLMAVNALAKDHGFTAKLKWDSVDDMGINCTVCLTEMEAEAAIPELVQQAADILAGMADRKMVARAIAVAFASMEG